MQAQAQAKCRNSKAPTLNNAGHARLKAGEGLLAGPECQDQAVGRTGRLACMQCQESTSQEQVSRTRENAVHVPSRGRKIEQRLNGSAVRKHTEAKRYHAGFAFLFFLAALPHGSR